MIRGGGCFWNILYFVPNYRVSHPRRQGSLYTLLWENQILDKGLNKFLKPAETQKLHYVLQNLSSSTHILTSITRNERSSKLDMSLSSRWDEITVAEVHVFSIYYNRKAKGVVYPFHVPNLEKLGTRMYTSNYTIHKEIKSIKMGWPNHIAQINMKYI
jgi:hypothetical protein